MITKDKQDFCLLLLAVHSLICPVYPVILPKKLIVILLNSNPFILWSLPDRVVLTLRIAPKKFGGIPNLNLHCTTHSMWYGFLFSG